MRALELPVVDYFSLDVEGSEYQILKTIPFRALNIKLFGIETEHAGKIFDGTEKDIVNILNENGYQYCAKTRLDKFFMKQSKIKTNQRRRILKIS